MPEGTSTNQPENPTPQTPAKGKFLSYVSGKIKAAGEWVNEGFPELEDRKEPKPLSKSAGEIIDKVLGSEESTKASNGFLQRWRGRINQMRVNKETHRKEFIKKERVDKGGLLLLELGSDITSLVKWGDRARAIVDGITGVLGLGILTSRTSENVAKTTKK